MTTIDHHRETTAGHPADHNHVDHNHVDPHANRGTGHQPKRSAKQGPDERRRLSQLGQVRTLIAVIAAQQRSHGLPEALESFGLQIMIEAAIREDFPAEYHASFPAWLLADSLAEHPTGVLTPACGICRSIANARGVNLTPPEEA